MDGIDAIGTIFGTYISGPMFSKLGYYAVFSFSLGFACVGCLYMIFFVKGSNVTARQSTKYGTSEFEVAQPFSYCSFSDVFATLKVVFKKRSEKKTLMIFMLIFNYCCYIFAHNGTEGTHRQLFVTLEYGWDEQDYTIFLTFYKLCFLLILFIALPFCSKILKLHDALTLILACITGAIGKKLTQILLRISSNSFKISFKNRLFFTGWTLPAIFNGQSIFIIGFVISSFTSMCTTVTRALITRCVNPDEVGAIFALIGIISAISSSLITAAYQAIYSATIEIFPAAFLIVNASFMLISIPNNIYLWKKLR